MMPRVLRRRRDRVVEEPRRLIIDGLDVRFVCPWIAGNESSSAGGCLLSRVPAVSRPGFGSLFLATSLELLDATAQVIFLGF